MTYFYRAGGGGAWPPRPPDPLLDRVIQNMPDGPKQGYQWPYKKDLCLPNLKETKNMPHGHSSVTALLWLVGDHSRLPVKVTTPNPLQIKQVIVMCSNILSMLPKTDN